MATFFGAPEGESGELIIFGLVYDHGSVDSYGCAQAARILRALTAEISLNSCVWDYATRTPLKRGPLISDAGDFVYRAAVNRKEYFEQIEDRALRWAADGRVIVGIGGDHSVTLPLVRGVASASGPIQVVQLDAHHDYTERSAGCGPTHSNFMSFVADHGNIARIVQVGVRGVSSYLPPRPDKVVDIPLSRLTDVLLPDFPVYLTIDTDCLDPVLAPAVGHPIPGGLSWGDLGMALGMILDAGCEVVGLDWTEYNPALEDRTMRTGVAIAHALTRLLAELGRRAHKERHQV